MSDRPGHRAVYFSHRSDRDDAINANATPTFGIFIQGNGNVPFDPAVNRIFVRFKDSGGVTRGSTSVAVRTGTPRFTLTDLGAFVPAEINNKGQIVGFSFSLHAVLYEDDRLYDLSTLGGFYSEAYSLNNRGQVVGFSWTTRGCFCHAFLWEDGAMTDLTPLSEYPTLANGKGTSAYDINNRGHIVGAAHIDGVVSGPVLWDNGEIIPLGTLGGTFGRSLSYQQQRPNRRMVLSGGGHELPCVPLYRRDHDGFGYLRRNSQ